MIHLEYLILVLLAKLEKKTLRKIGSSKLNIFKLANIVYTRQGNATFLLNKVKFPQNFKNNSDVPG